MTVHRWREGGGLSGGTSPAYTGRAFWLAGVIAAVAAGGRVNELTEHYSFIGGSSALQTFAQSGKNCFPKIRAIVIVHCILNRCIRISICIHIHRYLCTYILSPLSVLLLCLPPAVPPPRWCTKRAAPEPEIAHLIIDRTRPDRNPPSILYTRRYRHNRYCHLF